jgi:hypothetical protein
MSCCLKIEKGACLFMSNNSISFSFAANDTFPMLQLQEMALEPEAFCAKLMFGAVVGGDEDEDGDRGSGRITA